MTLFSLSLASGQNRLERDLINEGFENVKHFVCDIKDIIFVEATAYKSKERANEDLKKIIEKNITDLQNKYFELVMLRNGIPVNRLYAEIDDYGKVIIVHKDRSKSKTKVLSNSVIKRDNLLNNNRWKADLNFYPQFRFKNSRLDRIYLVQLNLNPTFELNLWRGAKLTAQLIIPLYNDYSLEESEIRPGYVTFSQHVRLPGDVHLLATAGNFNMFRTGVDFKLYKSLTPTLGAYGQFGATFWSLPLFHKWIYDDFEHFNWRLGFNYYLPSKKVLSNLCISKYLDNDIALRGEVVRFFSNSAVGFYIQSLQYEGYSFNGGFFFSIKLPPYKHKRKRWLRVNSGENFSIEYIARPYPQRGRFYFTSPEESSSFNFFNNLLTGN